LVRGQVGVAGWGGDHGFRGGADRLVEIGVAVGSA
jgi:hypothetical protein